MTKVTKWINIDGKRIDLPMDAESAFAYGWHLGADYGGSMYDIKLEKRFREVGAWCRESFDPHTFALFWANVWFYHERDAIICRLKWE